ncbi:MAG: beta-phosphoglucomutase [Lactobacillus sp.]|jgi:beta-phosphoglucomutase|nr:beta-phosphoglucomutase [Lactobacillus sp.]
MNIERPITGFVFDLDGVITDTAKYHYQAWKEVAKEQLGITLTPDANERLKGRSRMDSLAEILRFGGLFGQIDQNSLEAVAAAKNERYQSLIVNMSAADILPGMDVFLSSAQQAGYPMAVASASYNAPFIVKQLGLDNILGNIVNPGSVARGKPAPDLFEAAAKLINSPVVKTVGFEDATAGIEGIKAAGMFALGIGDPILLDKADLVVGTTAELSLRLIEAQFPAS